jgi:hypothetical protein
MTYPEPLQGIKIRIRPTQIKAFTGGQVRPLPPVAKY